MSLPSGQRAELQFLKQQIHVLDKTITTNSLKTFLVCALELYMSITLVLGLFQHKNKEEADMKELRYMLLTAWIPIVWGAILAVGHKYLPVVAPAPENLDRNLRNSKVVTWIVTLVVLIWMDRMVIKKGAALYVPAIFCVCDLGRFQLEIRNLIDDDEDEDNEKADQELTHAANVAGHAQTQGQAFKHPLWAIANHSDDEDDADSSSNDEQEMEKTKQGKAALHYSTMSSIDENAYQEYYGVTPAAKSNGRRQLL